MPENPQRQQALGVFRRPETTARLSGPELVATALTLIWLVAVIAALFLPEEETGLPGIVVLLTAALPVALIWVAATTFSALRRLRAEAADLQVTIDAMRHAHLVQQQAALVPRTPGTAQPAPAPQPVHEEEEQSDLGLELPSPDTQSDLDPVDLILALNFPEDPDDERGFQALRLALRDHAAAKLVRAAQDVLTLMAQDGIYMDDLQPDRAHPDIWRRFAAGERGRAIAAMGGVHDRERLTLTAHRMRQDPVFRDAAHHFLRMFDKTFAAFEHSASDQHIAALSETRTARAFMVLGRVTGTFD